ncbi:hypothetical protein MM300_11175 [Evansella sp. LMS18]|jgi:hypothetical protein|nr:hypothetical protein [Evansella sp. LMS18]UTR12793.1 hypothetical protein MM300_11175 [Evansella sp. LMS18]
MVDGQKKKLSAGKKVIAGLQIQALKAGCAAIEYLKKSVSSLEQGD